MDEDVILDWPWDKLLRWQIHDEIDILFRREKNILNGFTDTEIWDMLKDSQKSADWPGLT